MQSKIVYDAFLQLELIFYFATQLKILFSDHNHITSTFYLIRTYKDLVSYEQCSAFAFFCLSPWHGVVRGVAPVESFSSKEMTKNDESISLSRWKKTFYLNCIWQQQKRKENQGSSDIKCRLGCFLSSLIVFSTKMFSSQ